MEHCATFSTIRGLCPHTSLSRFHGFRYYITGPHVHNVNLRASIVAKADSLNCFGWTQNVVEGQNVKEGGSGNAVVGEARCNKKRGAELQEWIEKGVFSEGAVVTDVQVKVYDDTKIKLHFSHFKVLDNERVTCFRNMPHMCDEFKEEGGGQASKGQEEGGQGGSEEL